MKNVLKIDHVERKLIMDRTFAKYAMDTRSEEYAHLQRVRLDYPNYTVVQRQISRNSDKKTYNGLTYKYMEDYIKSHGTKEESKANLAEFKEKLLISKCHSKAFRYPVIKAWFLDKYPEIRDFGMPPKQEEINEPADANKEAPTAEVVSIEAAQAAKEENLKGIA